MGQDRPINALLPGFAQVHVFNSTRIKPFIPGYMSIAMYLGVFAQNTPRSRVSACFHLPSTASTALHVLSKCQTRVWAPEAAPHSAPSDSAHQPRIRRFLRGSSNRTPQHLIKGGHELRLPMIECQMLLENRPHACFGIRALLHTLF